MANLSGELPLQVIIEDHQRPSQSSYAWSGGGLVLTLTTVLPEPGLAFELISTYTGHQQTDTIATHLVLGHGRTARIESSQHPHERLNPLELARACAYDHASRLIEALTQRHRGVRVEVDEGTFTELDRVD